MTTLRMALTIALIFTFKNYLAAWSMGHCRITKGAFDSLPQWQKEFIGKEKNKLINEYCLYPDWFTGKTRKMVAPYIMPELKNGLTMKLMALHCDATPEINNKVYNYYIANILKNLKDKKNKSDGIKFLGTFLHSIEDRCAPAHSFSEDILWLDIKNFLPPPKEKSKKFICMHFLLEDFNSEYQKAPAYIPKLMGGNAKEVQWTLDKRLEDMKSYSRRQVIPIINAAYAENKKKRRELQLKAAYKATELAADFMYTMICLSQNKYTNPNELANASETAKANKGKGKKTIKLQDAIKTYKRLFTWGKGYSNIVDAALKTLPEQDKQALSGNAGNLVKKYSLCPEKSDFLKMDILKASKNAGKLGGNSFHMPINPYWDKEIFESLISEACDCLREGKNKKACEILGILSHSVIDRNSPVDLYKRNYYCLRFKDFLPPPPSSNIWQKGSFFSSAKTTSIGNYKPELLGESPEEIAFRLLCRIRKASLPNARKNFIPLLRAHYDSNKKQIDHFQSLYAKQAAKDVADLIHSIISVSKNDIPQKAQKELQSIPLQDAPEINLFNPNKSWAYNLAQHFWQWQWHMPNYVGRLWNNKSGGYKKQKPLELKINDEIKIFPKGFSQGADYGHTFLIPKGKFSYFESTIGNDASLQGESEFYFIVKLDGKEAYKSPAFKKGSSAEKISIPLKKAGSISLFVEKIKGKSSGIHAIWGKPILKK